MELDTKPKRHHKVIGPAIEICGSAGGIKGGQKGGFGGLKESEYEKSQSQLKGLKRKAGLRDSQEDVPTNNWTIALEFLANIQALFPFFGRRSKMAFSSMIISKMFPFDL